MKNRFTTPVFALFLFLLISTGTAFSQAAHPDIIRITVTSEPPGATVAIDRQLVGNTPITIALTRGKHLVRVSLDENWMPYIEEKDLMEDQTLQVTLIPRTGYLYGEGKKAFDASDYGTARNFFRQVTEVQDATLVPEAFFYLGFLDKLDGNIEAMEKNLKRYIELNPNRGDFMAAFPQIDAEENNYAVSVSHYLLGDLYQTRKDWGTAATMYKLSIPRWQRFVDTTIQPSYGNIAKYKRLITADANDYRSLIQLGYLYEMKGLLKESMYAYQKGAKALFNQSPGFEEKMGIFLR